MWSRTWSHESAWRDRWESDVRDLGQLLHFGFAEAKAEMSTTLLLSVFTSARRSDLTPEELFGLRREQDERLRTSRLALARVNDQVLWLLDQVFVPDRRATALAPLGAATTRFMAAMSLVLDMSRREDQVFLDEVENAIDTADEATRSLTRAVECLALRRAPRKPWLLRRAFRQLCHFALMPARALRERADRREVEYLMALAREIDQDEACALNGLVGDGRRKSGTS